ncbi:MAG: asparagine synthase (glutamine-hydrolyzing) [Nitrospirae bacterium]|nr:MAG: asparagine synthase (glutamine-hydrolyzing) [Nitrospirota bacterium]
MCAIAGLYEASGRPVEPVVLERMIQVQAHRGPDGQGMALLSTDPALRPISVGGPEVARQHAPVSGYSIGFGHRRLAIIDPSPLGHQPMSTEDGRCWVTYNGEIYNYLELREELRANGHRFRSGSDTEVLLAAYRQWGEGCLARLNGMFAFALWDGVRRRLFCARDRMGEKPFYYHWDGERFTFASEIKGLLAVGIHPSANHRAVFDYLEGACLDHSEGTFFEGIRQLPPAHGLTVDGRTVTITRYWGLPAVEEAHEYSPREAADRFRDLFRDAVRIRLRSDVAIGSCLSGGLDSSSIVCVANDLMFVEHAVPRELIGERQKTFSSCFEDPTYDERRFIRPVLERTGAQAHYTFPDPKELAESISKLVWHQDEPFGSTSIFAQWNVMRLAAQSGVKVLLDGQGADELLAGYHGFFGAFFADLTAKRQWMVLTKELLAYRRLHGRIRPIQAPPPNSSSHLLSMQYQLLTWNGLRALLHYEDRNSMAFGIETRLPFLDHRLVEFLSGLDVSHKIRRGWTKAILRDAMEGILPDDVRWRVDKMGFVTPEDIWFRTSLREFAREILSDARTRARGYLNVDAALNEFEAHAAGMKNISFTIWRWINLEMWLRRFCD